MFLAPIPFLFSSSFVNKVFVENLVIVKPKSAGEFVNFWFPLNNFSLLWPIDT
jgi:hypothetical protein